jgi:hypothetical protein
MGEFNSAGIPPVKGVYLAGKTLGRGSDWAVYAFLGRAFWGEDYPSGYGNGKSHKRQGQKISALLHFFKSPC